MQTTVIVKLLYMFIPETGSPRRRINCSLEQSLGNSTSQNFAALPIKRQRPRCNTTILRFRHIFSLVHIWSQLMSLQARYHKKKSS